MKQFLVKSMVEWLKRRVCGLGSKPTRAILLCAWERHFTEISSAWWSWQTVLNFSHISIKPKNKLTNLNCTAILASPEAGRRNGLPYV